ncbi:protein ENHANCED DISEASE RESISTANCE 4-like isoform X1 [Juglans microcarpa x Juglans regia]|uniref:protein ENHANCED DISEASE RESISTANCE 4-like isoform X1 n=1 Tax=Juglans microcarpa x Juglans regia TaxID=2249226 RepID=UPI001B7E9AB2|nr:protein ENHANCED DISEASE RESISTANCE 4-like isoform X1 [Juglans microcarpa x Juglans regia]
MSEGSKVRLVRCPKCDNVLPELPDYTVYKCGGCGAVLRAKKKAPGSAGVVEQSDEKWGRGGSEKLESLSEKAGASVGCASETDRESDGIEVNRSKERIFREKAVNSIGNSVSEPENKEDPNNNGIKVREEVKGLRLEQSGTEKEIRFPGRYMGLSECPDDYRVHGDDHDMNMNKSEYSSLSTGENLAWLRTTTIGRGVERDGFGEFYRNSRVVADQRGYETFAYPDEGPSSYKPESFYDYGEQMKHDDDLDGRNKVEQLEQDRAELLRKLDELKDQLSRSCAIENKPRAPVGGTRFDPSGQDVYNVSMQPFAMDKHVPRPPYLDHTHGNVPLTNHHNMGMQNFYPPPRHVTDEFPLYEEPYQPRMRRRPLNQPPSQYPQRAPNEYFHGQYMESNTFASYQPETFYHQPACSCLRCLNHNWQVLPRVPPISFSNRRIQKDPIDSNFYHCDNLGPHGYNPQASITPQLTSQDPQRHTRWTSDFDLDIDDLGHIFPRRVVAAYENRRHCYPVGDGAPFITCYICFELLKLPRRLEMTENKMQKLQCGGCSTVILFEIVNKKLIISVPQETKQTSAKGGDGSKEVLNESHSSSLVCLDAGIINSCSDDFDNSGYDLDLIDNRHYLQSEGQRLNLSESENRQGPTTSSISSSEEIPDTVSVQGDVSLSFEQPLRDDLSPKLSSSLLRDYSYYPSNQAIGKNGQGNNSERVDQDKMVLGRITSRQNSVEDTSVATELEVSFNDYLHTSLSQDTVEVCKEKDRPKINNGVESFFVGLIKKSFREFSRSTQSLQNERPNVSVNGQPIPDRLVKKAEKQAGPIRPGDYWYDFQAGFWGVMGHPCFGIIPPFIEEFNYAIPTNCAGGNTGVHVNGRELNKRDLDLLASRGLPTTEDRFYSVDISGKVVDEETGEELDGLGKLAPTVEKAKHGFGMKVPRSIM